MFLGLLIHPYRSMQLLVKNQVLLPFAFYPSLLILLFFAFLHLELVLKLYVSSFFFAFIYQFCLFFFFYWQLALFYLLFRFHRVFKQI